MDKKSGSEPNDYLSSKKNKKGLIFFIFYPVIFLIALTLYTAYNRFPQDYHPDEDRKIHQVKTGKYDFRHPALLLNATRLIVFISGGAQSDFDYCIRGRWASALFSSLSVVALMGAAHILYGRYAAFAAGITVALCPMLLESAHYMKEDTALVFGISCVILAIALFKKGFSLWKTILLGIACALAVSGKYIGIFMLIPALITILIPPNTAKYGRLKRAFLFLLIFFITAIIIDYEIIISPFSFFEGLHFESAHIRTSHYGFIFRRFSGYYPKIIGDVTNDIVIGLYLVYTVYVLSNWRRKSGIERLFILLPILYFILISSSKVQSPRYVIPVVVLIHWLGGMGAAVIIKIAERKKFIKYATAGCIYGSLITGLGIHSFDYLYQFKNDSRVALEKWISENITGDAKILQDWYVSLPKKMTFEKDGQKSVITTRTVWCAGYYRNLANARQNGFSYIAVSENTYYRFFDRNILPDEQYDVQSNYWEPRSFYIELFDNGRLLWESKQKRVMYGVTNPVIRLYDIRDNKDKIQNNE